MNSLEYQEKELKTLLISTVPYFTTRKRSFFPLKNRVFFCYVTSASGLEKIKQNYSILAILDHLVSIEGRAFRRGNILVV